MPKKATVVPSISLVFAEPEQSPPTEGSAAALLSTDSSPKISTSSYSRKPSLNSLRKHVPNAPNDTTLTSNRTEDEASSTNTPSRAPSQRSGWFGSLGRKSSAVAPQDTTAAPAAQESPPAATSSIPFPPSSSPPAPPSAPTPPSDPTPAPPEQDAAAVPATPPPPPPPPPPRPVASGWFTRRHTSNPSVDSTVPALPPFPDNPAPPEPATLQPRPRVDSASLNPSTSRFTLAMPLLGRPKVPLEQALGAAHSAAVSRSPSDRSSWWGYVGLASSSAPPPPPSESEPESPPPAAEAPPEAAEVPPTVEEASPEAAHQAPSAWYIPWLWYPSPPTADDPTSPIRAKTQAELVKEAALARPDPPPQQPSTSPLPPPRQEQPSAPPNPVLVTSEHRASWISFFSSAGARGKAIKETGEMEVMYVEEEHLQPATTAPPNKSPTPSLTKTPTQAPSSTQAAPPPTKVPPPKTPSATPPSPSAKTSPPSRPASPAPSTKKPPSASKPPTPPNQILPSFDDTFRTPPRSEHASFLRRTFRQVIGAASPVGETLPRAWDVLGAWGTGGVRRVVVVGIHGWFPGSLLRQVVGEPTGTSSKFASMMAAAVQVHFGGGVLEKVTQVVLEGEGTIEWRVNHLYQEYLKNKEWVEDMHEADAIIVSTHSQGSIVSTQLLDRLISEGHIRPSKTRVCCLAMCGIHLGPLRYLNTSSLVQPYLQYFESAAARELFEFQDSESQAARTYVQALGRVLEHGTKFVYVASMNDQVVPIYSGIFTTAAHPLFLRALYIDGEAHSSSDFLSKLIVLLLRIRNAGLDDGGLLTHLSEATAGSLSGVGHSAAYEEPATYALAVRFLFETSGALAGGAPLDVQPFTARAARNDYEIPWALRDMIANPDVAALFASEFAALHAAFDDWHPRTTILRELRRKLAPIRRLPTSKL